MPLAVNDVVRVSCRYSLETGQDHVNVYYWKCTTASTDSDLSILGDIHSTLGGAYANIAAFMTNLATPVDIKGDVVQFSGGLLTLVRNMGTIPYSPSTVPSGTGDALPPGNAALVKFLTGIGKVYGRKFVGALIEAQQQNGVLSSGLITGLQTYASLINTVITLTTSGALTPGVMSKKLSDFVAYNGYEVASNMAYQRRRRPGTGS